MASLSPSLFSSATHISISSSTTTSFAPFLRPTKHPSSRLPRTRFPFTVPRVLCSASNGGQNPSPGKKVDRRDMLLGLGGLYGASTLNTTSFANAAPVDTPDFVQCSPPLDVPDNIVPTDCCPPLPDEIIDFKPVVGQKLRVRPAAHLVDQAYIDKYKRAIQLMKSLPDDDPRSFTQQSKVHCAYCNGAYDQDDQQDVMLQVHHSWIFFPFHRFYLYFYERILGELIGDPTFALPFWNFDAPAGMRMPAMYVEDRTSPLYDELRNPDHLKRVIDLDFSGEESTLDDDALIKRNIDIMYQTMVRNSTTPITFFGAEYRAGTQPDPGPGLVESVPHDVVHLWTGDNRTPNGEDMANFYSAARDPIFYSLHSNVDRFWSLWKTLGKNRTDICHPDFLNTTFLFYDEKRRLVRVKVGDSLDTRNFGYVYQDVDIPWLKPATTQPRKGPRRQTNVKVAPVKFPTSLKSVTKVEVKRPRKLRSKKEKDNEEEILVIEGIQYDPNYRIKFDVFINNEDDKDLSVGRIECAGSFVNVRHNISEKKNQTSSFRVGINQLLEDVGAEGDDRLLVTIAPRLGNPIIGGVKIEYAN